MRTLIGTLLLVGAGFVAVQVKLFTLEQLFIIAAIATGLIVFISDESYG